MVLLLVLGLVALSLLAAAGLWAAGLWKAERENQQLIESRVVREASPRRIDLNLAAHRDLPAPVLRYFNFAFNGRDHVMVDWVTWRETGDFLLPVGRFAARGRQVSRADAPVFAWTGRFHRWGLPLIESRDAFLPDGHDMRAKLLGWFKVMHTDYDDAADRTSLHSHLLLRYYGQAPLMPWALLPNPHVRWLPNDDRSAHLQVTRPGLLPARYLVRFGDDGRIESMETDRLLMEGNGQLQREVGLKLDYREVNGLRVPTRMDYRWTGMDGQRVSHYAFAVDQLRLRHD